MLAVNARCKVSLWGIALVHNQCLVAVIHTYLKEVFDSVLYIMLPHFPCLSALLIVHILIAMGDSSGVSVSHTGSTFICSSEFECQHDSFYCDSSIDCSVECSGKGSCHQSNVYCPENARCSIICGFGEIVCEDMFVDAEQSSFLSIHLPYNTSFGDRLDEALIYCPDTINSMACNITGVTSKDAYDVEVYISKSYKVVDKCGCTDPCRGRNEQCLYLWEWVY